MSTSGLSSDELRLIRRECYLDPVRFCKSFLPHWFPTEIPWVHRGLLAILTRRTGFLEQYGEMEKIEKNFVWQEDAQDERSPLHPVFVRDGEGWSIVAEQYSLFMLPRGFAKTTIANAMVLQGILYLEIPFTLYVSEASPHAMTQLGNVKRELEGNSRILSVFGSMKPDRYSGKPWNQDEIETTSGAYVAARGRGGQVRGLLFNGERPTRIIMDDVENAESISTDDQRKKVREWVYNDLLPCLPELNPNASLLALGTLLHRDAILTRLRIDPRFTSVVFGAHDLENELLWPANLDEKKLRVKKEAAVLVGELSGFYREYYNQIRATEEQRFRDSFFKYNAGSSEDFRNAIAVDPAISEDRRASLTAIAVVGITERGTIRVQEIWSKLGASPRELIDEYFRLHQRWNCDLAGVESIAYQAALVHLLREEMFRKKRYFEIVKITHAVKKEDRINAVLQPRYAAGYIEHRIRFSELETQLLDFPQGKLDIVDVVAMAVTLLDPHAALAGGADLEEDEYDEPAYGFGGAP